MALTNEQIVSALISAYQRRGVQMTKLLSDPIFANLPTPEKIDFLKQHADKIIQGSQNQWTSGEKKRVLGLTALTSALGILPLASTFITTEPWSLAKLVPGRYKSLAAAGLVAAGAGAIFHGVKHYMNAADNVDARRTIRQELQNYRATGNDTYLVGTLSNLTRPEAGVTSTVLGGDNIRAFMPDMKPHFERTFNVGTTIMKQKQDEIERNNAAQAAYREALRRDNNPPTQN